MDRAEQKSVFEQNAHILSAHAQSIIQVFALYLYIL